MCLPGSNPNLTLTRDSDSVGKPHPNEYAQHDFNESVLALEKVFFCRDDLALVFPDHRDDVLTLHAPALASILETSHPTAATASRAPECDRHDQHAHHYRPREHSQQNQTRRV